MLSLIVCGALAIFLLLLLTVPKSIRQGPVSLPLVGCIPFLIGHQACIKLTEWAREYGSVYKVRFGSQNAFIVSSLSAAQDLMGLEGSAASHRPRLFYHDDIKADEWFMLFWNPDKKWRFHRKLMAETFREAEFSNLTKTPALNLVQYLRSTEGLPCNPQRILKAYTFSCMAKLSYNRDWTLDELLVSDIPVKLDQSLQTLFQVTNDNDLQFFPFLIPLLRGTIQKKKQRAQQMFRDLTNAFEGLALDFTNDAEQSGGLDSVPFCFSKKLLQLGRMSISDIGIFSGNMVAAGSDTTGISLHNVVCILAAHPNVQKKIQDDLELGERDYLIASIKEALRIRPFIPMGPPRKVTTDMVYEGRTISVGSWLLPNTWGINHDPDTYRNPDLYLPERYLGKSSMKLSNSMIGRHVRDHATFGYGRRHCPGSDYAGTMLEVAVESILTSFNIELCSNSQCSNPMDMIESQVHGFALGTKAIEMRFVPRMS